VPAPPPPTYAETLRVPLRWWAIGTMFHASSLLALLVAGLGVWAYLVMAAVVGITVALLLSYGAARIEVGDEALVAGRARIPLQHLARPRALDAEETRERIGPSADARAYLLLRPYVARSVVVDVIDRRDPAPYWLMSTRHPGRLAAALVSRVPGGPGGAPGTATSGVSPDVDGAD
jgi:hypothetical protein